MTQNRAYLEWTEKSRTKIKKHEVRNDLGLGPNILETTDGRWSSQNCPSTWRLAQYQRNLRRQYKLSKLERCTVATYNITFAVGNRSLFTVWGKEAVWETTKIWVVRLHATLQVYMVNLTVNTTVLTLHNGNLHKLVVLQQQKGSTRSYYEVMASGSHDPERW